MPPPTKVPSPVIAIVREAGRASGVEAACRFSGRRVRVRARCVINAAGLSDSAPEKAPDDVFTTYLTDQELPTTILFSVSGPNPFRTTITFAIALPVESKVDLKIYDVAGRLVADLAEQPLPPNFYQIEWNGTNSSGNQVGQGVYYYRFEALDTRKSGKIVHLKY